MVEGTTVDGRSPANQLRLVVYPILYTLKKKHARCRISSIDSSFEEVKKSHMPMNDDDDDDDDDYYYYYYYYYS